MANPQINIPSTLVVDPGLRLADVRSLATQISQTKGVDTQDGITASTTQTQLGGTKIISSYNNVSSANASDAITLPQSTPGRELTIINSSGQTIQVFPFLGDAIGANAVNTAVSEVTARVLVLVCTKAGVWWGGVTTVL